MSREGRPEQSNPIRLNRAGAPAKASGSPDSHDVRAETRHLARLRYPQTTGYRDGKPRAPDPVDPAA
jgi:hypothetical protein